VVRRQEGERARAESAARAARQDEVACARHVRPARPAACRATNGPSCASLGGRAGWHRIRRGCNSSCSSGPRGGVFGTLAPAQPGARRCGDTPLSGAPGEHGRRRDPPRAAPASTGGALNDGPRGGASRRKSMLSRDAFRRPARPRRRRGRVSRSAARGM
jgi:hypothetical protein